MSRISVAKLFEFEAAHHLPNYDGACNREHGHSYKLAVTVEGDIDEESGMVMDFSELKRIVEETIVHKWDHQDLNEVMIWYPMNGSMLIPTAESMVVIIAKELKTALSEYDPFLKLTKVKLWETSTSYAEWRRD